MFPSHPTTGSLTSFGLPWGTHLRQYSQDYQEVKKHHCKPRLTLICKYPKINILSTCFGIAGAKACQSAGAKTGLFTLNTSNRQPRLWMTEHSESVMPAHGQLNDASFYVSLMLRMENIKQNTSKLLTWTPCTYKHELNPFSIHCMVLALPFWHSAYVWIN